MTTARRIPVSVHEVYTALAEWHAMCAARTEPQRALAVAMTEQMSSDEYAARHAPFFFALLEKSAPEGSQ